MSKLVPKLRFPEFLDDGAWEEKTLVNDCVATIVKESVSREYLNLDTYISTDNLLPNYDGVKRANKLPPSGSFTQYKKGDVLVSNIRPYLKKVWAANKGGACSNDVIVFRAKEKCDEFFLTYILKNDDFINYVMKGVKGVKMPRGDIALMKRYPIFLPKFKEQKKIADCLSSLDDLITSENKKLEAFKVHKKGLLQNLFPTEGEPVPKWRFPEFRGSGEWEEKQVLEIGEIIGGGTPPKNEETYWNGNIPWISSSDIAEGSIFNINKTRFITKEAISSSATKLCHSGTICIVSRVGVGKVALTDCELCTSQDFTNITNVTENLVFMTYLLSIKMITASQQTQGTSIKGITIGEIKNMRLCIPSIYEQQKIADCLSSLDTLISAQAKKIEALKLHKKGLMQGLFMGGQEK